MRFNYKISALTLAAALGLGVAGCKKTYLDTNPSTSISANEMFKTTTSAYTALNGMHSFMNESGSLSSSHSDFGAKAMDLWSDVMGNDMVCANSGYDWMYYHYSYFAMDYAIYWMNTIPWSFYYKIVNNANNILDNVDGATGPDEEKNDIKGQAYAYRAWAYLNLVQWYQFTYMHAGAPALKGVPIYTTSTKPGDTGNGRPTLQENMDLMLSDAQKAVDLLQTAPAHAEKSHISLSAASGIAARVFLEAGQYDKARLYALAAYQDYPLMASTDYTTGFNSATNSEWIWASSLSSEQYNNQGIVCWFSHVDQDGPGYAGVGATRSITKALYDKISSTDIRKEVFLTNRVQNKFHIADPSGFVADVLFMRASEMYLIQAECEARMGNDAAAKSTLESLVTMRDPNYVAPNGGSQLLDEILLQRRIELWGEGFGFRDVKRLDKGLKRPSGAGNHSASLASVLNTDNNDNRLNMKIPQSEIDANPNIGPEDQNPF